MGTIESSFNFITLFGYFLFFITLMYQLLLLREKQKLLDYVDDLKNNIKTLKKKMNEGLVSVPDSSYDFFTNLISYIKDNYKEQFNQEITSNNKIIDNKKTKSYMIYMLGYQSLNTAIKSFDDDHSIENTWRKIDSQLKPIIENYKIIHNKDFEIIIEKHIKQAKQSNTSSKHDSSHDGSGYEVLLQERKVEILRLKLKIQEQIDEIKELQEKLMQKYSDGNLESLDLEQSMIEIRKKLADAELTINSMNKELSNKTEQIYSLQTQLRDLPAINSNLNDEIIALKSELTEIQKDKKLTNKLNEEKQQALNSESLKRDQLIARFAQESKEFITLIESLENKEVEYLEKIKSLEAKLN
ncbi:MAG: hypothetical protein HQL46_07230 [Gammaproteobacteria bacterium]|nr:hypothetical protein [Gammaproteobacteria bacterium]